MNKFIFILFTILFLSNVEAITITTTPEKTTSGTWTPAFSASTPPTVTYTAQAGEWVKRGPMVFLKGRITLSAASGGSGALTITGLPFTTRNSTNIFATGLVVFREGFTTAAPEVLRSTPNATTITAMSAFGTTNMTSITTANLSSTSDMIFEFSYFTDQ